MHIMYALPQDVRQKIIFECYCNMCLDVEYIFIADDTCTLCSNNVKTSCNSTKSHKV